MATLDPLPPAASPDLVVLENSLARVRWSAVWAGLVAATGLQIFLAVLGAAVGISVLGGGRASGISLGEGIWLLVILIITLFVGGMVAGRLAGVRSGFESLVHGTLVWALSLMLAAWLVGSATSHMLGGALNFAGNLTGGALNAAGAVVGPVAGEAAGQAASQPGTAESNVHRLADQARRDAEQRGLTPDSARALANNAASRVQTAAGEVAGQVHTAAIGSAWITLAAIIIAFFAAWLGARVAMPEREVRARV